MRRHQFSRHSRLILQAATVLAAAAMVGCATPEAPPPVDPGLALPLVNGQATQRVTSDRPLAPDDYVLLVRLQLIPVHVPFGTVSRSERLWSYLDEEVAGVTVGTTLNRNGFRVGRGRMDNWAPVGRLLREMAGRAFDRSSTVAVPGRPMSIVLQPRMDVQRIFVLDGQGRLNGRDYPPGDNVLMISCHLNADDPSTVLCQAVPLIRTEARSQQYVQTDTGTWRMETRPELLPLAAMEFTTEVPQGYYLVVGPAAPAEHESLAGNRFLVRGRDGLRTETVLVIVPEVFATPRS